MSFRDDKKKKKAPKRAPKKAPKEKPKDTPGKKKPDDLDGEDSIEQTEDDLDNAVEGNSAFSILLRMRTLLLYSKKTSNIPSNTDNWYEMNSEKTHMKLPVRVESVGLQPQPERKTISFGWLWACDGTSTNCKDRMTGLDIINGAAVNNEDSVSQTIAVQWRNLTYVPTYFTGSTWANTHLGRIWHALEQNIRSNKVVTSEQMGQMVKAYGAYEDMAIAAMFFLTYYWNRLDGYLNMALSNILASSAGSPMFLTRNDLRNRIKLNFAENLFLWPVFDWWKDRFVSTFPIQKDWYKYTLLVPFDSQRYLTGLARIFDAFLGTSECVHPETYLRGKGLWDLFRDNILPLIWGIGDNYEQLIGIDYEMYLKARGYTPMSYDPVKLQFLQKSFFTWPFDHLLGVGQDKNPQDWDDNTLSLIDWYWGQGYTDISKPGDTFFIYPDAFITPDPERPESVIKSPWLDLTYFGSDLLTQNYSNNRAVGAHGDGLTLRGSLNYAGDTFSDLNYDEFIIFFQKMFLRCTELETIKPDPDIDILNAIGSGFMYGRMTSYREPFSFPFRMPPAVWVMAGTNGVRRKFDILYSAFLGLNVDDIEIYRQQRLRVREPENQR